MDSEVERSEQLAPLCADREHAALLLDVDGTLAPIVERPDQAAVGDELRALLRDLARSYGLVACVSGRRATAARQLVGLNEISYIGLHGGEFLAAGADRATLDSWLADWQERVDDFLTRETRELVQAGVTTEHKGPIVALHWRTSNDSQRAEQALATTAARARSLGLGTHWARRVLEIRPPAMPTKGDAVRDLIESSKCVHALYVGDDLTDLDAFTALHHLKTTGQLETALAVAVSSNEMPDELGPAADLVVAGTEGVQDLLGQL